MDKGDIVRIKPNFHHPSRVGQIAKVIDIRVTGNKNPVQQCFVLFEDGQPDSIFEYDLLLVTDPVLLGQEMKVIHDQIEPSVQDLVDHDSVRLPEEPQKRFLEL